MAIITWEEFVHHLEADDFTWCNKVLRGRVRDPGHVIIRLLAEHPDKIGMIDWQHLMIDGLDHHAWSPTPELVGVTLLHAAVHSRQWRVVECIAHRYPRSVETWDATCRLPVEYATADTPPFILRLLEPKWGLVACWCHGWGKSGTLTERVVFGVRSIKVTFHPLPPRYEYPQLRALRR